MALEDIDVIHTVFSNREEGAVDPETGTPSCLIEKKEKALRGSKKNKAEN